MRLKIKTLHLLASLAVLNVVLAVISLIVVGVLIHKNPELCFSYSCANSPLTKLEGEQVKDSTQAMIPASPQVSPLATSTVIAPKIKTSTITPVVYSSEQDWTEKQYIQALVSNYQTNLAKENSDLQNDIVLESSISHKIAVIKGEGCQISVDPDYQIFLNKNGTSQSSCSSYYSYLRKQENELPSEIDMLRAQGPTPHSLYFCSSSNIPNSYKNYCLSLFN